MEYVEVNFLDTSISATRSIHLKNCIKNNNITEIIGGMVMAKKGKKEICESFRSHCWCRVALLFFQIIIFLVVFLFCGMFIGRELPCEEKPIFLLRIGLLTGFFTVALEAAWCRNCPFFRTMVVYYRMSGYFLFIRFFVRLIPT